MKRFLASVICLMLLAGVCLGEGTLRLEFEDGQTFGGAEISGQWVSGFKKKGDGVSVSFEIEESGLYDISVIQASYSGIMKNDLLLDGEKIAEIVAEGNQLSPYTVEGVQMDAGAHELSVMCNYGWIRVDAVEITKTPELNRGNYTVSDALCNPNPSKEAAELFTWICDNYGVNMISGQYLDEGEYGRELGAIAEVTGGLYPALLGLDMMNYSPSSVSLGSYPVSVDQALEYWKQGHIITFCWHWVAPEKYLNVNGNAWWSGFYTDSTSFNLEKALSGEDAEGYNYLLRDLDAIARQLTRLRDAGVPVIWRPLHEASGGWFWWGASGKDAYIELYRLMYDKFTNEYGLNNLIWLWNGQSAAWYPGDDVVDIIGEDLYPGKHVHTSQSAAFAKCLKYTQMKKPIFLSECGCVPSPEECIKDNSLWGAWGTWCYEFVLDANDNYSGEYTSAEKLREFYAHENVITLKDVPAFGREALREEAKAEVGAIKIEFEDGEMLGCAKVSRMGALSWADISGNAEGDGVKLAFSVPSGDTYTLTATLAGIGGYKENYIYIDGEKQDVNLTVQGTDWEESVWGSAYLDAGEHTIEIKAFWGWVKLDSLTLTPENPIPKESVIEFEDGALSGEVKSAFLGSLGWVELKSNDENDAVTVTFTVPADGTYDLIIRAAGIGGYKENYLTLDGERIANTIVSGTDWEDCPTQGVYLTKGEHELKVSCFWGWCKLDNLTVVARNES